MRWIKLIVLLVLSAVGARAAELFDCIPEQAALAVRMRTARFFAAEPLRALTESGDVSRIREELALIPWNGGLPDAVLLYFGATQSYAVLVECRTEPEELKRKILTISKEKIMLLDYTKFGDDSMVLIARPEDVDVLITDWHAPDELVAGFGDKGVKTIMAPQV